MITGELRNRIDKLWEEFWTGGITNPLTVIEQITFLMFIRLLDMRERREQMRAHRTGNAYIKAYRDSEQHLRWHRLLQMNGRDMLKTMREEVFPHLKTAVLNGLPVGEFMKDAQLLIQKESLLVSAVNMIESLPLDAPDTKGDLYEYLLSKLTTAGINGQFRTPRHVIRFMVEMLEPTPDLVVGDPACGTGGFLVGTMEYLLRNYTSPEGVIEEDGQQIHTGDLLTPEQWSHIRKGMFHGFDFDTTMLRTAAMNLLLHGVDAPAIHYQDTLSGSFSERYPQAAEDGFDLILANPPFKGSLDAADVHPSLLRKVKTRKTELLFVVLMLRMLKLGGRCAVIVPQGVLFGSSGAHVALRKLLVDENQLEAVLSLPAGVFRPYAGVATAILAFTKGGRTDQVFFGDVRADGFSLDDKRDPVEANDLPTILERWRARDPVKDTERTGQAFFVPAAEIKANKYDLSLSRYQEAVYEEERYDPPEEILARMKALNAEIARDLTDLEGRLG